jgi:hypothetical protein
MPEASELPAGIKEFAYRNALKVDSGQDFHPHIDRLIGAMDEILGIKRKSIQTGDSGAQAIESIPGRSAFSLPVLFWYVAVPTLLLWIFHYLIVFKLDLNIAYLRVVSIGIPLLSGFLLFWQERQGLVPAFLMGAVMAAIAVLGMLTATGMIDDTAIIPTSVSDWQRTLEFVVGIALAVPLGNQIARFIRLAGQRNSRRAATERDHKTSALEQKPAQPSLPNDADRAALTR